MDMTLRWFGEGVDSVSLEQIRQIPGVKGVITTLYDIPAGEVWPMERILQMKEQVEAVQRMQDYIQEHLRETVTLADLSKASHFSPWYSARLFRKLTGLSPADYIRRYKLSRSALRLRDEDCKVIDVAFDLGFGSVDGYQRAFLREFGCNPREYAAHPVPLYLMTPYGVKYRFTEKEPMNMEQMEKLLSAQ
mgnify:CR=1 FL=1